MRDTSALLREEVAESAVSPRMRAPSAPLREAAETAASLLREVAESAVSPRMRAPSAPLREAAETAASLWEAAEAAAFQKKTKARTSAWREADEDSAPPKKKATITRSEAVAAAAEAWFPPERYVTDLWTEVAKHLAGSDIIRLSCTCCWFHDLLADDSIWRYAFYRDLDLLGTDPISGHTFFRDLHLPVIKPLPHRYWHLLYVTIIEGTRPLLHKDSVLNVDGRCVSGFLVHGDLLATARLPVPKLPLVHADSVRHGIELMGTCLLPNACHGVWIADMQVVNCPGCSFDPCIGSKMVLDLDHCDMVLKDVERNNFENKDMGHYSVDRDVPNAFCAVLNSLYMDSDSTVGLLDTKSWIGNREDKKTRTKSCPYAVAMNSNLQCNQGILSVFEAVRNLSNGGQLVWIRISQFLGSKNQ